MSVWIGEPPNGIFEYRATQSSDPRSETRPRLPDGEGCHLYPRAVVRWVSPRFLRVRSSDSPRSARCRKGSCLDRAPAGGTDTQSTQIVLATKSPTLPRVRKEFVT